MIMCNPHCSKEWPFWHEGFADFSVINEDSPELHFILPFIILATHSSFNSVSIKLWPAFVSVLISLSRFLFISSSPVVIPTLYLNFLNLILFLSKIQTSPDVCLYAPYTLVKISPSERLLFRKLNMTLLHCVLSSFFLFSTTGPVIV